MSISYVNGKYLSKDKATISIEDRGFNFSDGVYEVINFSEGKILNFKKHVQRLERSLSEIEIIFPFANKKILELIIEKLISFNYFDNGFIYLQITRGSSSRNHLFPLNTLPNIVISLYPKKNNKILERGVKVISSADLRWGRCDIKSVCLLANVLGKQMAYNKNVYEVWQTYNNGIISEGTTSNSFIVSKNQAIITHPKNNKILGGVTRDLVLEIAKKNKMKIQEREFKLKEVYNADEAFLTSTTVGILPVLKINDRTINNGIIGKVTKKLIELHKSYLKNN